MVNNAINIKPSTILDYYILLYCSTTSNYTKYIAFTHTKHRKYFLFVNFPPLFGLSAIFWPHVPRLHWLCCALQSAHIFLLLRISHSCNLPGGGNSHFLLISSNFMTSFRLGRRKFGQVGILILHFVSNPQVLCLKSGATLTVNLNINSLSLPVKKIPQDIPTFSSLGNFISFYQLLYIAQKNPQVINLLKFINQLP